MSTGPAHTCLSRPGTEFAEERATLPKKLSQMETRKAGWLFKQGGGRDVGTFSLSGKSGGLFARKNWKNRFFVLQDTMIKYYKTEIHTGREEALGTSSFIPYNPSALPLVL